MMEPIKTATMHVNESKALRSPLSCSGRDNEEISKKLEDELLYAGEDGDEDDALSDDSLRLRLSDDEADADDSERTSSTSSNQLKSLKTESLATANSSSVDDRLNGTHSAHNNVDNQEKKFKPLIDNDACVTKTEKLDNDEEGAVVEESKDNNQTEHGLENNIDLKVVQDQSSLEKVSDSKVDNSSSVNGVSEVNSETNEDYDKELTVSADKRDSKINDDSVTSTLASSSNVSSSTQTPSTTEESESPADDPQDPNNSDSITYEEEILEVEEEKPEDTHVVEELGDEDIEEEDDIITIESSKMKTSNASHLEKNKFSESTSSSSSSSSDDSRMDDDNDVDKSKNNESSETSPSESDKDKSVDDKANNVIAVKSINKLMSNSEPDTTESGNKRRLSTSDNSSTESPSKKVFRDNATSSVSSLSATTKQSEKDPIDGEDIDIDESITNESIAEIEKDKTPVDDVSNNDSAQKNLKNGEAVSNVSGSADGTTQDGTCGLETPDNGSLETETEVNDRSSTERQTDVHPKRKTRRKKRRGGPASITLAAVNQGQEKENVRQKRETAQKAQEIIRKYNDESDSESSEQSSLIQYNKPISHNNNNNSNNNNARSTSPPALKRNNYFDKDDSVNIGAVLKKPKRETDHEDKKDFKLLTPSEIKAKPLEHVRTFFLRDCKQKLSKFTQEELEELLVQKIVETITMRDEIGKLREQAKISERNQEATRSRCQQLAKHVKDFDMVIKRYESDRKLNEKSEKFVAPIKINRSVGLQVNFVTDQGVQNLRQLAHKQPATPVMNGAPAYPIKQLDEPVNNVPNTVGSTIRTVKGIKVRSPRKIEPASSPVVSTACLTPIQNAIPSQPAQVVIPASALSLQQQQQLQQQHKQQQQQMPMQLAQPVTNISPATLVVSKQADARIPITSNAQIINHQLLPNQSITFNGVVTSIQNTNNRPAKVLNVRTNNTNNDNTLIDLTGEEEKNKKPPPLAAIAPTPKDPSATIIQQKPPPRYQRIVHSAPAVTLGQSTNIKVIQPSERPTPTALVNNMTTNASKQLIVMKGNGTGQQLLISNHQIRPAITTNARQSFPGIAYTTVPTLGNASTLRVVTTAPSNVVPANLKAKHPAPLPAPPPYPITAGSKLPPPAPSLKISKVATGIVLSWNMVMSDKHADIASYQLYAYQEVGGTIPSSTMWKKVGDVRALALPMACTLTQFSEGNVYYFAVRAVDTLSRFGHYSQPGSISL